MSATAHDSKGGTQSWNTCCAAGKQPSLDTRLCRASPAKATPEATTSRLAYLRKAHLALEATKSREICTGNFPPAVPALCPVLNGIEGPSSPMAKMTKAELQPVDKRDTSVTACPSAAPRDGTDGRRSSDAEGAANTATCRDTDLSASPVSAAEVAMAPVSFPFGHGPSGDNPTWARPASLWPAAPV